MLQNIAHGLTLANLLSFLRLVLVPFFIIAVLEARLLVALALFLIAALTDWLDGTIARWLNQQTELGAILDPLADKLLTFAAYLLLSLLPLVGAGPSLSAPMPLWLCVLAVFRDLLIVAVASAIRLLDREVRFPPSSWGRLTSLVQFTTLALFLAANAAGRTATWLRWPVLLTAALILVSGFHYLARTVRLLAADQTGR